MKNQQIFALESNKKIQKLENQLEEERQLFNSFETVNNDSQNNNLQEAVFTEETKDSNQQQENNEWFCWQDRTTIPKNLGSFIW